MLLFEQWWESDRPLECNVWLCVLAWQCVGLQPLSTCLGCPDGWRIKGKTWWELWLQGDGTPVYKARWVNEWFDKYENKASCILWPSVIKYKWMYGRFLDLMSEYVSVRGSISVHRLTINAPLMLVFSFNLSLVCMPAPGVFVCTVSVHVTAEGVESDVVGDLLSFVCYWGRMRDQETEGNWGLNEVFVSRHIGNVKYRSEMHNKHSTIIFTE